MVGLLELFLKNIRTRLYNPLLVFVNELRIRGVLKSTKSKVIMGVSLKTFVKAMSIHMSYLILKHNNKMMLEGGRTVHFKRWLGLC